MVVEGEIASLLFHSFTEDFLEVRAAKVRKTGWSLARVPARGITVQKCLKIAPRRLRHYTVDEIGSCSTQLPYSFPLHTVKLPDSVSLLQPDLVIGG